MPSAITISGLSGTEPAGSRTIGPLTYVGAGSAYETWSAALTSGDNTIAVPLGAGSALVITPTGSTATLKYRTSLNSGDAGVSFTQFFFHVFPATAPTSVIVNSSGAVSAPLTVVFA